MFTCPFFLSSEIILFFSKSSMSKGIDNCHVNKGAFQFPCQREQKESKSTANKIRKR